MSEERIGEKYEIVVDLMAGWASGTVSLFVSQPIDTMLTRIQATPSGAPLSKRVSSLAKSNPFSLWNGSLAMIGAIPVQNALLMAGYGYGKRWTETNGNHHITSTKSDVYFGVFVGGCVGGFLQSFLMSPVELIKVNQQVAGKNLSHAASMVATGIFQRNVAWKGLEATVLRDCIPHGVWFVSYEWCKNTLVKKFYDENEQSAEKMIGVAIPSGAFAALTAWGVGYPFDIIKTRIQARDTFTHDRKQQTGIWNVAKEIVSESKGYPLAALYRGFSLKLAKAIPASAINFFVYESLVSCF